MKNLTPSQKALFDALHKSRLEDFKTFNKKSYRGVWSTVIDKYPESAHFVYELLQNADDAEATQVYIILQTDKMLFKHNGTKHFDITREDAENVGDINSITGIGDSSKIDTQNKIGKFGVGFKAVFQYTDTPEIYDDYFKFKIENYIVPTLLSHDHPNRAEGETLFVFPFKDEQNSFQEILNRLENLQNPILFLRNLQRIIWRVDNHDGEKGEETEYSKKLLNTVKYEADDIILRHYRLHEPARNHEILLFSQEVCIPNDEGTESNHWIHIGYYYDPIQKSLITDSIQNIFCFFPTKETFKTCFVSHAPFLLTDNRQNLKPNENLNRVLANLLAELAAKAIVYLRDYKIEEGLHLINENITEIIPNYGKHSYWLVHNELFEEPIKTAFRKIIEKERVLLSRNGKYLSLKEAYIGSPKELVDLLNQQQLYQLRKHYHQANNMLCEFSNIDFLQWELSQNITRQGNGIYEDINRYSSELFANDIDAEFMRKQNMKWVTRMYNFLITAASKLWKVTESGANSQANKFPFRKAPIIKTQKGEWVAPFIDSIIPNVYLPLKEDKTSNYNFIANEYIENEIANKFFRELDIKEPDEADYIRQVILKKFEGKSIEGNNEELKTDFGIIVNYFIRVKEKYEDEELLKLVKEKLFLQGKDEELHRPSNLFFYNKQLEYYFNDYNKGRFLDIDFYAPAIEKYEETAVNNFISRLGVKRYPTIQRKIRRTVWNLNERIRKQILTTEIAQTDHIEDYELEGFIEFCNHGDLYRAASLFLWNEVLPAIGFGKYDSLSLVSKKKYARTLSRTSYISSFKDALIHEEWLMDKDGNLVSPANIALEDLDPGYDKNNGLLHFLGIEKREKSITELGGTEEQQAQYDLGKRIKNLAGNLTDEEIIQAVANANAKKKENAIPCPASTESMKKHFDDGSDCKCKENQDTEAKSMIREELRKTAPINMFVNFGNMPDRTIQVKDNSSDEEADNVLQKLMEQEEKRNKIIELRKTARSAEKYSKEWFETLIELEYRGDAETGNEVSSKSICISFSTVRKEHSNGQIYIFTNPSRSVPMWMEEIGDIEVKCAFSNREELTLKFEVANVRDNSLRLKASKAYENILSKIEWNRCTKASITLKNQIDLMGKLRTAFHELDFDEGYNLKEHLDNNIQFIFGPPGTGKTTTLAKKIIYQMNSNPTCRILVLTPTNTACDELARKIQDKSNGDCQWLSRFISTADENLEDIVIDRDSLTYKENKCCIISTIARLSFDGFSGMGGNNRLTDIAWDMVICDEASMIPLAEIALAIYTFLNTPILIAGDPMQIKPILREEEWKNENIYTMVKLDRFDNPVTEPIQFAIENLGVQYRSVPAIGELFSQYAYDGKLKHHRAALPNDLSIGKLKLKPINFIPFKVERFDSIFGVKKLDGSNVHIYSALFTIEMLKYIMNEYPKEPHDQLNIGIVCPYAPQAQLIESLILQISDIPLNINIIVGTVHRFQGGQCNLMLVVLNPPLGLKVASDRIFLNNKNILNVAISRAQEHLCVLLPHCDTVGYESLYEINALGKIAMKNAKDVASYTCDQIEEIILGRKFFIETNTFVTSHQLTNVYTKASNRYEVRIDENSIDIQLGGYE